MVSSNKRHLEFLIAGKVWGPINHQVQVGIDCCLFKVAASEQYLGVAFLHPEDYSGGSVQAELTDLEGSGCPALADWVHTTHAWAMQVRLGRHLEQGRCQERLGDGSSLLEGQGVSLNISPINSMGNISPEGRPGSYSTALPKRRWASWARYLQ